MAIAIWVWLSIYQDERTRPSARIMRVSPPDGMGGVGPQLGDKYTGQGNTPAEGHPSRVNVDEDSVFDDEISRHLPHGGLHETLSIGHFHR